MVSRQDERPGDVRPANGFLKKGKHSVGVARQYCGQLGKQDNCQVAVTLSIANDTASLPIAHRLYLPETWARDSERRKAAKVPDEIVFQTKPEIALDQIKTARAAGVAPGVVLADAGYGHDTDFRTNVTSLGLNYVMGVQGSVTVWAPGEAPVGPKRWSGRGRRPSKMRRTKNRQPVSAKELAKNLPAHAWKTIKWREGTNEAWNRGLPPCECIPPMTTTSLPRRARSNGCCRMAARGRRAEQILALDSA